MTVAPAALARRARAELDAGRRVVLATLVGRDGPSYLPPGAQVLLGRDGPLAGLLSGGCVEQEVAARTRHLRPGEAARLRIDTSADEIDGLGVGCGGQLEIVADALDDAPGWRAWLEAIAGGRPAARRIAPAGSEGWTVRDAAFGDAPPEAALRAAPHDVRPRLRPTAGGWLEVVPAPPTLVLVGDGPEVEGLALRMARMGWRLRWVGPSRAAGERLAATLRRHGAEPETVLADAATLRDAEPTRAPWGLGSSDRLVAASRRLDLDAAAAAWGLRAGVRYLGVVAGEHRRARLVERPELAGLDATRIEAPAGVAIGAEGPEEVATALAARLVADLRATAAPVWALIPAAGAGRRMGGGKLRLRRGGESLIGRALRTAEASCDGTLVVLGHDAEGVRGELDASADWVTAERWCDGLAASLRAGLTALPADARAVVLLPDMPGVGAEHVAALRAAATTRAGAVSRYPNGARGAPAVLPVDLVDAVRAAPPPGAADTGFAALLADRADVAEVPLAEAGDLDTPEAARAAGWRTDATPPAGAGGADRGSPGA